MKTIRFALSAVSIVLLTIGFLASQHAFFNGNASAYAAKVDQMPVRMLAALVLLSAIVFAFIPDKEGDEA